MFGLQTVPIRLHNFLVVEVECVTRLEKLRNCAFFSAPCECRVSCVGLSPFDIVSRPMQSTAAAGTLPSSISQLVDLVYMYGPEFHLKSELLFSVVRSRIAL